MKNKISALISAIVMTLGVALGGVITAAPAQAASDTTIWFTAYENGTPSYIKYANMNNRWHNLGFGLRKTGVKKVCPPNSSTLLTYENPRGSHHALGAGECTYTSLPGTYQFNLWHAER